MKYYRNDSISEFCKNKRVLHIGATASPYHIEKAKENLLLHQKLQTVCNELIGIDKDRNTIKKLKEEQEKRLKIMIDFAYKNVPYYHKLFNDLNLNPYDVKKAEDLEKLPILTKEIIKQNWEVYYD